MAKISVIVPIYNDDRYLQECLDTIINQTFEDIEIICVNDGSTDESLNILKQYESRDCRVKVISQENKGVGAARNAGIKIACGEYIYFIDADDYLELTGLEEMYDLSQQMDLDLLIFKLVTFDDETGERNYNYSDMPFLLDIGKDVFSYTDFKKDLFKVDVTVYTKFFRKELIEDKRFLEGLIFEDNAFYFDYIFDAARIHFYDKCLHYRRIRKNSLITAASRNHTNLIEVYENIYQKFKDRGLYEEFRESLFMRKVDSFHYRFTLINPKYKNEYYSLMKSDFTAQKDEYEREFDLEKIDKRTKRIFHAAIESDNYVEFEDNLKPKKKDNSSSNAKLIKILKKFKRKSNG